MLRVHSIVGNTQRLDGGAMFGNAPRALWERWCTPDSAGRIPLACRAVLVQSGERTVLLETGIGAFFEPKLRHRYGVTEDEHVLLRSLAAIGVSDADVDTVVLSHLHFDHAGGLLSRFDAGAPPRLLFPNAAFVVGRTAFERAKEPHRRDRASFIADLPKLLEASGRLVLVEPGSARMDLLGESFDLAETHGHTPGLLHVTVLGKKHRVFFCSDLVPGIPWIRLAVTMGYDRNPEHLVDEKAATLARLADDRAWLALTHDANVAFCRIESDGQGEFRVVESKADDAGWTDLDA